MGYCSQCGTQLPTGARFCTECGTAASAAGGTQIAGARLGDAPLTPAAEPRATGLAPSPAAAPQRVDRPEQPLRPAPATIAAPRAQPGAAPDQGSAHMAGGIDQPIPRRAPPPAGSNAAMWVLPALLALAVLAFGWWWMTRDTAETAAVPGQEQGAPARGGAAGVGEDRPATGSGGESAREDEDEGASGGTTFVSAATLDTAFARDRDAAALRCPGPVTVTGTIATMVQPGSPPSLSLEGRTPFNYMIVNFPIGYRTRLAPLMKGQTITVACSGARHLGATTILSDCELS